MTHALNMYDLPVLSQDIPVINIVIKQEQEPPKEPKLYTIKEGQTLTSIATENNTTVERLWEANTELVSPDLIEPNNQLRIPLADEELPDRPLPVQTPVVAPKNSSYVISGSTSGNTYTPGNCTWHVKNLNPRVPNGLGNASEWKANWSGTVSSVPVVGAVAWRWGHVAQVISVGDGTVTISEMNYNWTLYATRTITVPVDSYTYLF